MNSYLKNKIKSAKITMMNKHNAYIYVKINYE